MKRDNFIPSAIPVEAALHQFDAAERELNVEAFMGAARDAVIYDLCNGERVGKFLFRDVLDSALDDRASVEIPNLADVLLSSEDERGAYVQRLVSAFVDRNAKLVEDRATELAEEADECARAA